MMNPVRVIVPPVSPPPFPMADPVPLSPALATVRIVLVEPAGALNLGSVARVMKNMGLQHLVLVAPRCHPADEDARRMAVHGKDVLAAARTVPTLEAALAGCQRAVATTGRDWGDPVPVEAPEAALPWLLATPTSKNGSASPPPSDLAGLGASALIFGPEDRGLNNQELNLAQRIVRIPTGDVYPSLNLAQAVGICVYLLRRCAVVSPVPESPPPQAALDQVEQFLQQLESLLLAIGYLYPHTATSRMAKIRRILHRSALNPQELAMLRGVLRQVNWALRSGSSDP